MEFDPQLVALWQTALKSLTFTFRAILLLAAVFIIIAIPTYALYRIGKFLYSCFFVCVPEGYELVVERRGRFHRVLRSGIHFLFPILDHLKPLPQHSTQPLSTGSSPSKDSKEKEILTTTTTPGDSYVKPYLVDTRKQFLRVPHVGFTFVFNREVFRLDTELVVVYRISDSKKACYEYSSVYDMIRNTVEMEVAKRKWKWSTTTRNSQQEITAKVLHSTDTLLNDYGVSILDIQSTSLIIIPDSIIERSKVRAMKPYQDNYKGDPFKALTESDTESSSEEEEEEKERKKE